jgi:hypothetical protein
MDKTAWLFGALLLIVGIAGVCAAVKTLGRIERQALIMERQLALQAAAMRQWVEVTEWTATVDKREDDNSKEFTVGFDIRNPTKLPLIIHKTEVRSFTTTLTNDVRVSIIPEGRHRIWFTFGFNETMQKEYATLNSVSFPIQLTIWLVDAMEKMQDQRLGGLLLYEESSLGKEIVVFIERADMVPKEPEAEQKK